jgi:hypothetical protein
VTLQIELEARYGNVVVGCARRHAGRPRSEPGTDTTRSGGTGSTARTGIGHSARPADALTPSFDGALEIRERQNVGRAVKAYARKKLGAPAKLAPAEGCAPAHRQAVPTR